MTGSLALFFWAFAESIFFPVPPDALLMALVLQKPDGSFVYALIVLGGSLMGAVGGYVLGIWGGRRAVMRFVNPAKIDRVERLFQKYGSLAVAVAGFTPIPYKLFTISAGIFRFPLGKFLAASTVSRGARFLLEATLVRYFGYPVLRWLQQSFDLWSLVILAVSVILVILYKVVLQPKSKKTL